MPCRVADGVVVVVVGVGLVDVVVVAVIVAATNRQRSSLNTLILQSYYSHCSDRLHFIRAE